VLLESQSIFSLFMRMLLVHYMRSCHFVQAFSWLGAEIIHHQPWHTVVEPPRLDNLVINAKTWESLGSHENKVFIVWEMNRPLYHCNTQQFRYTKFMVLHFLYKPLLSSFRKTFLPNENAVKKLPDAFLWSSELHKKYIEPFLWVYRCWPCFASLSLVLVVY
jgi:hypothetical protein